MSRPDGLPRRDRAGRATSHRGSHDVHLPARGSAGALVISALVGGTIISAVAASTLAPATPADPLAAAAGRRGLGAADAAEYCATFRRAFAANLGVDESAMAAAAKAAAIATIAKAVADGRMTKAAGDRLKARLEAADGRWLRAPRRQAARDSRRRPGGGRGLGVVRDGLTAAAKALGVTPGGARCPPAGRRVAQGPRDDGRDRRIATVSAAALAAVKADLDKAVAAGTIRQARADRVLDRITRALADGRLRAARPGAAVAPPASPVPSTGS